MLKLNKKNAKRVYYFARVPRGCDVALRATWQRHTGPRGDVTYYIYIYIGVIVHIVFRLSEEDY